LGGLEISLVRAKPSKASCGDGNVYQQTSISKTVLPNYAKFTKMRATPFLIFLLKWLFLWLQLLVHHWKQGSSMKLTLPAGWLWFTLLAVQTYCTIWALS